MKDFIDEHAEKLVKKLEDAGSGNDDTVSTEITEMEKMAEFFREYVKDAPENVVMEMEEEYIGMIRQGESILQRERTEGVRFMEGAILPESLEFMFGDVREDTSKESTVEQSEVSIPQVANFQHGTAYIRCLNLITDTEAWVNSYRAKTIERVDSEGKVVSDRNIGYGFEDFTMVGTEFVCTVFADRLIRRVSPDGRAHEFSVHPLYPNGICSSRDGKILVCLADGDVMEIAADSYGEVHYLDLDGKLLRKYPDKDGDQSALKKKQTKQGEERLFKRPYRLTQNVNLDLCVVDVISTEPTSRVVVVTTKGRTRFEYRGQPSMGKFSCTDICCDQQGQILLSDYRNNAVHLLTEGGDLVHILLTRQSIPRGPRCMALIGDRLWMGCNGGDIRVFQYHNKR